MWTWATQWKGLDPPGRARVYVEQSIWNMTTSASSMSASASSLTACSVRSFGGSKGVPSNSYVRTFHPHQRRATSSGALGPDMMPTAVGNSSGSTSSGASTSLTCSNGTREEGEGATSSPVPCPEAPGEFQRRSQRRQIWLVWFCPQAISLLGSFPLHRWSSLGSR